MEDDHGATEADAPSGDTRALRLFLIAAVTLAALVLALASPLFDLETVHVRGVDRLAPEEVVAATELDWGTSVWTINREAVAERVAGLPRVEAVTVSLLLPNRLEVAVVERTPVAVLAEAGGFWDLDAEGTVLGRVDVTAPDEHPLVTGTGLTVVTPGERLSDARIGAALAFLGQAPLELHADLSEVRVGDEGPLVLYTRDPYEVHLPSRIEADAAAERMALLQVVLDELRGKEWTVIHIDLRIEGRPVVRLPQEKVDALAEGVEPSFVTEPEGADQPLVPGSNQPSEAGTDQP